MRRGVFPGSFNPPTTAHLAISQAACHQHQLDQLVWCVSRIALAKEHVSTPSLEHRLAVLTDVASELPWLAVEVTDRQLLVDIARGFDVVVMGADKWQQIHDVGFYGGSEAARDASIAALPTAAIAPRGHHEFPAEFALRLPPSDVSSTAAREGAAHLMLPAAARFDELSGAWSDPERYLRWSADNP